VDDLQGVRVNLSDGLPATSTAESISRGETTVLSDSERSRLLSRLPALTSNEQTEFAMREKSLPPPKTGVVVPVPFPAPDAMEKPDEQVSSELEVLRFAPEGEVKIAPHLTLSFNQPMVPMSSQEQVSEVTPVTLEPAVDGEWVWLGTQTLQFKPTSRFPMATKFVVTVPEGVTSERQQRLAKAVSFEFATPPARLIQKYPTNGPQKRRPYVFLGFDQRIKPSEVAPLISFKSGFRNVSFRVLTTDEVADIADVQNFVQNAPADTWMVIQPRDALAKGSKVSVWLEAGVPSAEGPRLTSEVQSFSFQVYSELAIKKSACGWWRSKRCSPTDWWVIEFNNPLEAQLFDPKTIKIEPSFERAHISVSGSTLRIGGRKKGRTAYTVTVPKSVQDIFGQTLGQSSDFTFKVGPADPVLQGPRREFVVLDPKGKQTLPIYTTNRKDVRLRISSVQPSDRELLVKAMNGWRYRDANPPTLPGTVLFDKRVSIEDRPDELVETSLDLAPYFEDGFGHLLVWVEAEKPQNPWDQNLVWAWVQSTQLAVSAQSDKETLQVWGTRLSDGTPAQGAEVELYPHGIKSALNSDGLAQIPLPDKATSGQMLILRQGKDSAILPASRDLLNQIYSASWKSKAVGTTDRWFVFDDRGMYNPGESARIKGWVRNVEMSPTGDVRGLGPKTRTLSWAARDVYGNEFARGQAKVSALGGFDFAVDLPKTVNLGQAAVKMTMVGVGVGHHSLDVQEFVVLNMK
jgi:hypothetical protein